LKGRRTHQAVGDPGERAAEAATGALGHEAVASQNIQKCAQASSALVRLKRTGSACTVCRLTRHSAVLLASSVRAGEMRLRPPALGVKVADLRRSRQKLADKGETGVSPLSEEAVARVRAAGRDVVTRGPARMQKALLQALVHEVRVEGRHAVVPRAH